MKHLLRRPAAITLVVAVGVGVACAIGLNQQADPNSALEFRTPLSSFSQAAVHPDTPPSTEPNTAPRPLRLTIPRLDIAVRVLPTGVNPSGGAEIPADGDEVGWYEFSAAPGDPQGSSVLIGHRDTIAEGPGALYRVDQLRPGDRILVTNRHATLVYLVVAGASFDKQHLPPSLFRTTGPHRLRLMTCGGAYLPEAGGYQENLVITAALARTVTGPLR